MRVLLFAVILFAIQACTTYAPYKIERTEIVSQEYQIIKIKTTGYQGMFILHGDFRFVLRAVPIDGLLGVCGAITYDIRDQWGNPADGSINQILSEQFSDHDSAVILGDQKISDLSFLRYVEFGKDKPIANCIKTDRSWHEVFLKQKFGVRINPLYRNKLT